MAVVRNVSVLLLGVFLMPVTTIAAEAKKAVAIECSAAGEKYAYECVVELRAPGTGGAIVGAQFMVGAQMPSMAGAHRVEPVEPVVVQEHGQGWYGFRMALKKYGEWAITMDFS